MHNDYLLALDKTKIKKEMLCNYQLKITDSYSFPTGNVKKLVPHFFDKEKYVVRYENLQLYLRLGLKLKKHRVLVSNQPEWLRPYVELNAKKKKK